MLPEDLVAIPYATLAQEAVRRMEEQPLAQSASVPLKAIRLRDGREALLELRITISPDELAWFKEKRKPR